MMLLLFLYYCVLVFVAMEQAGTVFLLVASSHIYCIANDCHCLLASV